MTIDATNVNPTVPGNSDASRDVASYLHPYTNLVTHEKTGPHIITGGDGIYVIDGSGREASGNRPGADVQGLLCQ